MGADRVSSNPRQLAFAALRSIQRGVFADVALDKVLQPVELAARDRGLLTELVYGCVRRQRTLDFFIDCLATKPATQQPPELRLILHIGFYQLHYLDQVPPSAAVNTTVELAKQNGFAGLTGFVNGLLRQYLRQRPTDISADASEPVLNQLIAQLPHQSSPATQLGIWHSYPDWIVEVWLEQFGVAATEQLCRAMNQPPPIDLRINTLRTTLEAVEAAMQTAGISTQRIPHLPQALRLPHTGNIQNLPGFQAGEWIIQDSGAQLVGYLVDPQPGEVVVDACAAPGGKTLHLAELMGDRGQVWACDRAPRLKKLQENCDRLGLRSIHLCPGDSRTLTQFKNCDRVLVDAPCSGLGTLNRHADARWRQTPESVEELAVLQQSLLTQAATWVKPQGSLVYSTCTLHPAENEAVLQAFLSQHPTWQIQPPAADSPVAPFANAEGWIKVLPHEQGMDGFFMVRLQNC
jgi:16S rRNA (cytosine967-C5)-methyltransferase